MSLPFLALVLFISLGMLTVILQHFFFKEEFITDEFNVIDKKKEDCCEQYYNPDDAFSAFELMAPFPSSFWVHLKKPGQEIKINDEELFNKVSKDQIIKIRYKRSYWKFGSKEIITNYQVLNFK